MPIEFFCDTCHVALRTPDETAGKMVRCPKCGNLSRIPILGDQVSDSGNAAAGFPMEVPVPNQDSDLSEFTKSAFPDSVQGRMEDLTRRNPFAEPLVDSRQPVYRLEPTGTQIRRRLVMPGILMMVISVVGLLSGTFGAVALFGAPRRGQIRGDDWIGILFMLLLGFFSLISLLGGVSMVRCRNFFLAVAGSFSLFIVGVMCCLLPWPVAIWSLIVLFSDDCRRTFSRFDAT